MVVAAIVGVSGTAATDKDFKVARSGASTP